MGQERFLEAQGEAVHGVVEPGPVQCLGDQAGEGGEDRSFVGGERVRVVVGEDAAADGPAGDEQRQEGPGAFVAHQGGLGELAGHLLDAGEERRDAGGQHVPGRGDVGAQGQAVEAFDGLLVVAVPAGDLQTAGLGRGEDQAVRTEGGQDLPGDQRRRGWERCCRVRVRG